MIIYEPDPARGKRLDRRQTEVAREMLLWFQDAEQEIAAGLRCPDSASTLRTTFTASSLPGYSALGRTVAYEPVPRGDEDALAGF